MERYARVLSLFWSTSISAEMEYRLNFLLAVVTSLGHLGGGIFSLSLLYGTGYTFPGWSWEAALVVLGLFSMIEGFSESLLNPNLSRIVRHVQQGTLDFVLLKPIDSQFWLSLRTVSPWGLPSVALGLGVCVWAGGRAGVGLQGWVWLLASLFCGLVILYSMWFVLGALSIWFVKIYNVTEVLKAFTDAGRYPISAYPQGYRIFFTFVVPVAFMTTLPAEAFLGRSEPRWLVGAAGLAVGLFLTCRWFWRFALRFYTSASS